MNLDQDLLNAALVGLELQRARVADQISLVKSMIAGNERATKTKPANADKKTVSAKKLRKQRKPMSPEARQRIVEAQKKRWAAKRGE